MTMNGTVEVWATESLLAARKAYHYQMPETGQKLKPGQTLGDTYFEQNLPVVRTRLYQAAVKSASVLNEVLVNY